MHLTPQHRLTFATLLVIGVIALAIHFALRAPMLDLSFTYSEEGGLVVSGITATSPNAQRIEAGASITRLDGVAVNGTLLIEEPDQLGAWDAYNGLLATLKRLDHAAASGAIQAQLGERSVTLLARARTVTDLPFMFWFQLALGTVGFLIAFGVYAFRPQVSGAMHFAFAGLGMLTFSTAAATYSTRELIMNGDLVRLLSATNQLGANLFTAALVALLWVYPKSLSHRLPVPAMAYILALLFTGGFTLQIYPDTSVSYLLVLSLFSVSFVFAFLQWRKTAGSPVERAALKWYLLSIYLGTGLFAAAILVPAAIGIEPPASQGLMFAVFLFMFVGIAFGITRYRLFDLDRWWLAAWSWFLSGVVVIGLDALLVSAIGISQGTSLALSLALVGWLYFPVRQWLFTRLRREGSDRNRQISRLVQSLFSAEEPEQLADLWRHHLAQEWAVLETQIGAGTLEQPRIGRDGQSLAIPHLIEGEHLLLHHPFHGSRLFTSRDQWTITLLYQIARRAKEGLTERLKAYEERRRIFGDLHDDVGSKLLSLLYRSRDPANRELVRSALEDLRDVVSQPDEGILPLADMLADLRAEAQERLDGADIELSWEQTDPEARSISVFRVRHLARILRESLNNVIKHADASEVTVRVSILDGGLRLTIVDDGNAADPALWSVGRGINSIRHRLEKLDGAGEWRLTENGGCRIEICVPLDDQVAAKSDNAQSVHLPSA